MSALVFIALLASAPAADGKAEGPSLGYEQFRQRIELEAEEKREQQIDGILRLLELGPEPDEIPDLQFRLAELYFEKSQFFFFRAQEAQTAATTGPEDERGAAAARQEQFAEAQKEWSQRSLEAYQRLRVDYPRYVRMPEVLFALGQAYWNINRRREAIDVYAELIRGYPESPLLPEAWIAYGEFYFDEGDVRGALDAYERAAENKRSRVYGFAVYKQAWCHYNLGAWDVALKKFRTTVIYAQLATELSGENKIALGREAQRDYVRTYSHVGTAARASAEFADLLGVDDCSEGRCKRLLESLADAWFDTGNFSESAVLYRQLVAMDPADPRNALRQAKIVDLVARSGRKKAVISETRKLIGMMRTLRANEASEEVQTEASVLSETTLRRLAQLWNKEARKTRSVRTRGYARTLYEDYLKLFDASEFAYEMRFQLADLYYALEQFPEAAAAYEATVLAEPEGKYLVSAANDNILAIEEHLKDLKLPTPPDSTPPPDIPEPRQQLVAACDRYVAMVPPEKAEQAVAVKFKAAKVFYDYSHFDEAVRRFDLIVSAHPETPQAEPAANLVVDVHNLREDWQALYDTSVGYLARPDVVSSRRELRAGLQKYAQFAKFKLVSDLEAEVEAGRRRSSEVAEAYLEFYREFPGGENADKALFNASVAWDRAGDKLRADELRRELLESFPDSPLRADVAHYIAKRSEQRTEYLEAARAFAAFSTKYPEDARARDALYNAAVFYAGSGRARTAEKLRLRYLRTYGRSKGAEKEGADIYWAIATDLERAGRTRSAADRYRDFSRSFPNDARVWDALWREAQLRRSIRQRSAAARVERTLAARHARAERAGEAPAAARRWVAQLELDEIDDEYRRYLRQRIAAPDLRRPKRFRQSLAAKAASRDALLDRYSKVVTRFRDPDASIEALNRVAKTWEHFVQEVTTLPCPRGIGPEACDRVKLTLEETVAPAREASLEAYQTCADRALALQVYGEAAQACIGALEEEGVVPMLSERRVQVAPRVNFWSPPAHGPALDLLAPAPAPAAVGEGGP